MNRKNILVFAVVLLAFLLSFTACKGSDPKTSVLTVLVSEGVTGSPAPGAYTLTDGSELQYNFRLNAGYTKLTVLLDGNTIAASGKLTISGDQTLLAYADDDFQYGLTVTLDEGVIGTPAAGTKNYSQGTLVNYTYTLQDGYYDLKVLLNGTAVESSGTITMSQDHKLTVSALKGKVIRGTWELVETYKDESTFTVTATFSGGYAEGIVVYSDGGSGIYIFSAETVYFTLVFPDVNYSYTGAFSNNDSMNGSCIRYRTAEDVVTGTWTATRKTATTATARHGIAGAPGKKGTVR